jgi:hypothetical protein
MGDPVKGTAQVVSASMNRGDGVWQNCHMELVIAADGILPQAVTYDGLVHRNRWPFPGMVLPVTVDRENPGSFTIEWDDMPTSRERAQDTAQALAAAMGGQGGGSFGAQNVQIDGDVTALSDEQRAKLRMLGVDVDARVGAAGARSSPGPAAAGPAGEDGADDDARLARLERLAALRAQGMLTDEEFEEQKRRILD